MAKQQVKFVVRPRDYLLVHNKSDRVVKTAEGAVGSRYNLNFFINPGEAVLIRGKHFAHTGLDRAWDRGEVHVHQLDLHAMETVLGAQTRENGVPTMKHAIVMQMLNKDRCVISSHPLLQPVLDELCITIGHDLIVIDEDMFNEQHTEGNEAKAPAQDPKGPKAARGVEASGADDDGSHRGSGAKADVPTESPEKTGRGGEPEGSGDAGGSQEVQSGTDADDASGADTERSGTGDGASESEDLGDSPEDAEREEVEAVDDGRAHGSDGRAGGSGAGGTAGSGARSDETSDEEPAGGDDESGRVDHSEAEDAGGTGEGDPADDGGDDAGADDAAAGGRSSSDSEDVGKPESVVKEKPEPEPEPKAKKKSNRAKKKRS